MVSINYSAREVCCKIVYYGPGLSGKTTNLQYIHSKVPQNTRGKLISLATEADRTLYFDFLPINIGTINDFQAKFQLYTVPGQVYYNATRKLVLRGVDGIVFVADSQPDKMDENLESLANLEENLVEYGYNPDEIPMVVQFNKCDLPGVMSPEEMNARLNDKGRPYFQASATLGNGVFDTLKLIIKLVLEKAKATGQGRTAPKPAVQPPPVEKPYPERTQPAAPQAEPSPTATAVEEPPAPAPEPASPPPKEEAAREAAYRPYPGSDKAVAGRKSPVSGPTRTDELPAEALGRNIGAGASESPEQISSATATPQMAPSLRRRGDNKKRGFFKRLFGIK